MKAPAKPHFARANPETESDKRCAARSTTHMHIFELSICHIHKEIWVSTEHTMESLLILNSVISFFVMVFHALPTEDLSAQDRRCSGNQISSKSDNIWMKKKENEERKSRHKKISLTKFCRFRGKLKRCHDMHICGIFWKWQSKWRKCAPYA